MRTIRIVTAWAVVSLGVSLAGCAWAEGSRADENQPRGGSSEVSRSVSGEASTPQGEPTGSQEGEPNQGARETLPKPPIYRPPMRGAPVGRIAGGTRGILDELPVLCVLTPDHTGLTIQEQPSLYWFISEIPSDRLEFTVVENETIEPILEVGIEAPKRPGVQRIRLADYAVRLQKGRRYKWFIALVPDPDRRSKDTLAFGAIERVELPESLREELKRAGEATAPNVYAGAGLWYDALDAITTLMEGSPAAEGYRRQRASLLEQVGLHEVARYDLAPNPRGPQ